MTKTKSLKDVRVALRVYAQGVSGAVVEVERWDDISLNEASMHMKDAFRNYNDPQVKIFKG